MDNGVVEVGVALDFGLRICHFSFFGKKNVFYEQPNDMTALTTEEGWRLRGGHRLWIAPECEEEYFPDNESIRYALTEDGAFFTQKEDPALRVVKEIRLQLKGNSVYLTHRVTNTGKVPRRCALWAISVMAPGGVEHIPLALREDGYDPLHRFSLWDHSSLGDERVLYKKDEIVLTHMDIDKRYKLGVGHPGGDARYENGDIVFVKHYAICTDREYPDGNVSFETFLSKYMVEVESLSPLYTLDPGGAAEHDEVWTLYPKKEII